MNTKSCSPRSASFERANACRLRDLDHAIQRPKLVHDPAWTAGIRTPLALDDKLILVPSRRKQQSPVKDTGLINRGVKRMAARRPTIERANDRDFASGTGIHGEPKAAQTQDGIAVDLVFDAQIIIDAMEASGESELS